MFVPHQRLEELRRQEDAAIRRAKDDAARLLAQEEASRKAREEEERTRREAEERQKEQLKREAALVNEVWNVPVLRPGGPRPCLGSLPERGS